MKHKKYQTREDKIKFLNRLQQGKASVKELVASINPFNADYPLLFEIELGIYENGKTGERFTDEQLGLKENCINFD